MEKMRSGTVQGAAEGQIFTSEGSCFFSQSFNTVSMRVCQPLPVDLKASITSGEYRMVADFLRGAEDNGLPRRIVLLPSCRLALSKKASSSSGASSGSIQVLFKSFNFAFISFPHRDNAARLIALRPDHNNKPGIQFAYGNVSDFSVVLPGVFCGEVDTRENLCGSGEINTAFQQRFFSLALVVFNIHIIIVVTLNKKSNVDSLNSGRYTAMAAAKSVAGIGVLVLLSATNDASASFLLSQLSYTQIMVGWVGAPKGAPVSDNAGYANPAQLTTSEIGVSGGGVKSQLSEVAIMATIPAIAQPEITVINGQAVTSSLAVADYFTKRHDDVLKKIRALECSPDFTVRNFAVSEYTDATGRKLPCYQITRDGFAFLAMGFTGKRAAQFKESYITAFNQMEKALIGQVDTSSAAHNAHVAYLYMSEIHRVWMAQLYPMLVASQSPIAHSLYDYINDGVFVAGLVDCSLNGGRKGVRK